MSSVLTNEDEFILVEIRIYIQINKLSEISSNDWEFEGVPIVVQWKHIRPGTMRFQVRSLALLSGLRIRRCHELWCRLQAWLRFDIAVPLA